MTPELEKIKNESCFVIAHPMLRDMLSRGQALDMCKTAFDAGVNAALKTHPVVLGLVENLGHDHPPLPNNEKYGNCSGCIALSAYEDSVK